MSDKEEKGFTVVDRRRVTADGSDAAAPEETRPAESRFAEPARATDTEPAIDFGTFAMSLASSALFHLGELVSESGEHEKPNLPLAKQTIDILGMLAEKTRGNLSDHEAKLVEHLLYDLRLKYVEARKQQ